LFLRARRWQAEEENLRLAVAAEADHRRLNEIVSNVPGMVWETIIDPETNERKTTFVSDYVEKILGYTTEEWLAQPPGFGLRIMPDDEERERASSESEAVINSAKEGFIQYRWTAKDGRVIWVEAYLTPILHNGNGKVVGLRGVTLDVNSRKQAEENVRQTQERSRAILRAMPDLMFLQTREGVYLDYYAKDSRELLAPPSKFLGRGMRDVLPAELAEKFLRCFERAEELGEPQILEYQLNLNAHDQWFEARIVRSGEHMLTLVREITQRILSEEAIKRNEAQLAGIIGSAMDAIITVDESQRIMLFNAAAERVFGCSADEAIGQPLNRFVPTPLRDAQESHISSLTEMHRNGFSVASLGSLCGRGANGRDFPVEASISQLELQGNNFYTIILRDVTERVRAEAALLKRKEQLSEAQRVAKVGSWEWDPATDSVTWSEELYRIMGRDPSLPPVNYESHPALYTPASWALLKAAVDQALQHGTPYELELQTIRADGTLLWTNARGEVLKDATGRVVKLQGTLQDIAERKQAEADLKRAVMEVSRLKNQLEEENIYLKEVINLEQNFGEIVGQSDALKYVLFKVEQVAPTETTVLITGETGTGKELVARAIHKASPRRDRPLVKVNCGALSASLIESELFGHEKGAFTGASARKIGRFELADGATIFLDEIGDLPSELQVKLLRVIQEGELERLGSSSTLKVDVRIIAATNRNLDHDVKKGLFREDLWYRLNVFPITVPPLRQRREDIPLLIEHFIRLFNKKFGKTITSISPTTLKSMRDDSWPGNVRELANVIERATINSHGSVLKIGEDLETSGEQLSSPNKTLEEMERDYIIRILEDRSWRIEGRNGAARLLGLNPSTLRTRMARLGIQKPKTPSTSAS
jgi:PAS domain S-box-containing protein